MSCGSAYKAIARMYTGFFGTIGYIYDGIVVNNKYSDERIFVSAEICIMVARKCSNLIPFSSEKLEDAMKDPTVFMSNVVIKLRLSIYCEL
jgi:hypothetical protein